MEFDKKEYNKNWYEQNKEKHLSNSKEKIKCDICNCMVTKGQISTHNKTKKHLTNTEKIELYNQKLREQEQEDKLKMFNLMIEKIESGEIKENNINKIKDLLK